MLACDRYLYLSQVCINMQYLSAKRVFFAVIGTSWTESKTLL